MDRKINFFLKFRPKNFKKLTKNWFLDIFSLKKKDGERWINNTTDSIDADRELVIKKMPISNYCTIITTNLIDSWHSDRFSELWNRIVAAIRFTKQVNPLSIESTYRTGFEMDSFNSLKITSLISMLIHIRSSSTHLEAPNLT